MNHIEKLEETVEDPHRRQSKPIVGYLAHQLLLKTEIPGSDIVAKANEYLPERFHITLSMAENPMYTHGEYLVVAAVNAALDKLGITEIRTATLEDILCVLRTKNFPEKHENINYCAVLLYDEEGTNEVYARDIAHQLRQHGIIQKIEEPLLLTGLRAFPDDHFPDQLRLIFDPLYARRENVPMFFEEYTRKQTQNGARRDHLKKMVTTPTPSGGLKGVFLSTDDHIEISQDIFKPQAFTRVLLSRTIPNGQNP